VCSLSLLLLLAATAGAAPATTCRDDVGGGEESESCARQPSTEATRRDHALIQVHNSMRRKRAEDMQNIQGDDVIFMTTSSGHRLGADDTDIHAFTHEEHQELFTLERGDDTSSLVSSGDEILLRTYKGNRVTSNRSEVHAKWNHRGDWERFIIQRVAGNGQIQSGDYVSFRSHWGSYLKVEEDYDVVAASTEEVPLPDAFQFRIHKVYHLPGTRPAPGTWHVGPAAGAICDPEMNCFRSTEVTCRGPDGTALEEHACEEGTRPDSHEPCHRLGENETCVNIGETDCVDVPGCWWNPWNLTCGQLEQAKACSPADGVELPGFDLVLAGNTTWADRVAKACPVTCGSCTPAETPAVHPATEQCEAAVAGTCADDLSYDSVAGFTVGRSCSMIDGASCDSFAFAADLKAACPVSCGLPCA